MQEVKLDTPIEYLKGVGPARAESLKKELSIHTFYDLLYYFPFRYEDRSRYYKVAEVNSDLAFIQLRGKIQQLEMQGEGRAKRLTARLVDDTGSIELVWFQGVKYLKDRFKDPDAEFIVYGKPALFNRRFNITHPEVEPAHEISEHFSQRLHPVYSSSEKLGQKGLNSKGISKIMRNLILQLGPGLPEVISSRIIDSLKLMPRYQALYNIHFPDDERNLERALLRLKFEELLFFQLSMLQYRNEQRQKVSGLKFLKVGEIFNRFYTEKLPFTLTNAQMRAVREIRSDLGSGQQMNRLLQGDVGSGKTLVALMSMLIGIDNGFQSCLMAPTEILANQHYNTISGYLEGLPLKAGLLTGSTRQSERRELFAALESGELNILTGTHALLEDTVKFNNLGLVVIDEQHRFGVAQRAKMWTKSSTAPHILVMTATPIPRTLAMTLYGDLDYTVIDELPPGRIPVKTFHLTDSARLRIFEFMRDQIRQGRQVYVVYPLIEESESLDLKDLMDGYESLSRTFPIADYQISIVHGRMPADAKEYEMKRFVDGTTQIMVSTTVIEVGVDVPNASVMIIENAERFGLSQLHQLRGRVGRGAEQSYCLLVTGNKMTHEARKRIETLVSSNDGFHISEVDLQLRGPGDIQGTRQSGMINLRLTDIAKDEKIIRLSREVAGTVLEKDPELMQPENQCMRSQLRFLNRNRLEWGVIS